MMGDNDSVVDAEEEDQEDPQDPQEAQEAQDAQAAQAAIEEDKYEKSVLQSVN